MNKMNFKKEEATPRMNYVITTCDRTEEEVDELDYTSNIKDIQTVISAGAHVSDLKPGTKVRFEKTSFPKSMAFKNKKDKEGVSIYNVPVFLDENDTEFIWMSDRAVMFIVD